jgi:exodeoxyribonuclease VII small subunit
MKNKQLSYNEAIAEIETIIEKLENEEIDVDELTKNVKRVSELLNFCKTKLKGTEEEVQKILKNFEQE